MNYNENFLRRRLLSFKYAFNGIKNLFQEPNAIIHLIITVWVIVAGILLSLSTTEWCLILFAIAFVFVAEAINTSIEALSDYVCKTQHPIIKITKDLAAGAVLLAALVAAIVGLIVFLPKIIDYV